MRIHPVLLPLLPALLLTAAAASGSTAHLVADLEPGVDAYNPEYPDTSFQSYTPVNGRVVFLSLNWLSHLLNGMECNLWTTDGTAEGTERLVDLCGELSDSGESFRIRILAANGEVAFFSDAVRRLWRTDGTAAGTYPIARVAVRGTGMIGPDGRTLFFSGCRETEGCEPWASDGTPAGTRRLRDAGPGSAGSNPIAFTAHGRRVLFAAAGPRGPGLWATDGTAAGTVQLASSRLPIRTIASAGRQIYFGAWDSSTAEVWVLQERSGAAWKVKQFSTDFRSPGVQILTAGGRVFLNAVSYDRDYEVLWETDGTSRGTRLLGHFSFPFDSHLPSPHFFELDGRIVFPAYPGHGGWSKQLWYLDPGMKAPLRLQGCPGGCPPLGSAPVVQTGDRLVFSAWDAAHGHELWTSDGTPQGTRLLKDVCPGACSSRPGRFLVSGDRVFFSTGTADLWVTDGTTDGTFRIASRPLDDHYAPGGPPLDLAEADGRIVFTGFGPVNGPQPWASDLTPAGTKPLGLLGRTLGASLSLSNLTPFGRKVLFTACDGSVFKVFVSDGTAAGTVQLPFPVPDPELACFSFGFQRAAVGDLIFVTLGETLWRTDGTPAGTFALGPSEFWGPRLAALGGQLLLHAPVRGSASEPRQWEFWTSDGTREGTRPAFQKQFDAVSAMIAAGNEAFFFAGPSDSSLPATLWRTDGTEAGTRPLLSVQQDLFAYWGPEVARLDGRTFFLASSPERLLGTELWVTDGTAAGTSPVIADVNAPGRPYNLQSLAAFQGHLYFFAGLPGSAQAGLWRSDGTAEGTTLLKRIDLRHRQHSILPPSFIPAGDTLFFWEDDGVHGAELWATDGTAEGTRLVHDIAPGRRHARPAFLAAVGDTLFFTAMDGEHGLELWESDGTAGGTRLVEDIFPGPEGSVPSLLTPAGDRLFFTADDGRHGRELWVAQPDR
jgi:ELWxxDGT repeat protein